MWVLGLFIVLAIWLIVKLLIWLVQKLAWLIGLMLPALIGGVVVLLAGYVIAELIRKWNTREQVVYRRARRRIIRAKNQAIREIRNLNH